MTMYSSCVLEEQYCIPSSHCTPSHCTPSHCTPSHCTPSHCTPNHCTPSHCTPSHCTPSHCTQITSEEKYKNKLTDILRYFKKQHYMELLEKNKGNIKETWKILNSIINKKLREQHTLLNLVTMEPQLLAKKILQIVSIICL